MIDRGATTIWETWKESDNIYSNCHPMFGSITEWYYRWLGGIRPLDEHPGFEEFILAPSVPDGLDSVRCSYQSPRGSIFSGWTRISPDNTSFHLKIPEGTVARVNLNRGEKGTMNIEKNGQVLELDPAKTEGLQNGWFRLGEGEYVIQILSYQPAAESNQ
jgi:alpha-L-rhamnosidase